MFADGPLRVGRDLGEVRRALALFLQFLEVVHEERRFPAGLVENLLRFGAGFLEFRVAHRLDGRLDFLRLFPGLSGFPGLRGGLFPLRLQGGAALFKGLDDLFEPGVLFGNQFPGPFDDVGRKTEAFGDGERVGTAGRADDQTVRRRQRVDVELTGGIGHPRRLQRVCLQLGIVGRRGQFRALQVQALDDRHGQRRALDRVGARAEFVDEHQRVLVGLFQDVHDVRHVGRERGQRLLDGLFIADVREDLLENAHFALVVRREHEAGGRHEGHEAQRLDGHGLAAGVRAGDDQRVEFFSQTDVGLHDLPRVDERVAGILEVDDACIVQMRSGRLHGVGHLCLGKDQVQVDAALVALFRFTVNRPGLVRQVSEDPLDLLPLLAEQDTDLVVRLDDGHRLDEDGGSGVRSVLDDARDVRLVLALDRHDVPAVAHGDDGVLQDRRVVGRMDDAVELVADLHLLLAQLPPDVFQFRRRIVRHAVLRQDRREDALLKVLLRGHRIEVGRQRRVHAFAGRVPVRKAPDGAQGRAHRQQFAHGQDTARGGDVHLVIHIDEAAKRGTAVFREQHVRVQRLPQQPFRRLQRGLRLQFERQFLGVLGLHEGLEDGEDLVVVECEVMFVHRDPFGKLL